MCTWVYEHAHSSRQAKAQIHVTHYSRRQQTSRCAFQEIQTLIDQQKLFTWVLRPRFYLARQHFDGDRRSSFGVLGTGVQSPAANQACINTLAETYSYRAKISADFWLCYGHSVAAGKNRACPALICCLGRGDSVSARQEVQKREFPQFIVQSTELSALACQVQRLYDETTVEYGSQHFKSTEDMQLKRSYASLCWVPSQHGRPAFPCCLKTYYSG
nr:hypothetical protein CFP56_73179 [Quercus suber]